MAQQMVLTFTIETDGRQADANQHMVLTHTIETDGRRPHNRNRWPHNSQATAFCHAWPILLFVPGLALYPLLICRVKFNLPWFKLELRAAIIESAAAARVPFWWVTAARHRSK